MSDDSPGSFRPTSRFCGKSGYPFGSNVHELALECSTFSIAPIPATCKTISTATVSASSSTHLAAPFTQSSFWSFRYEDGDELRDFDALDCGPDSQARDRTDKRGPSHQGRSERIRDPVRRRVTLDPQARVLQDVEGRGRGIPPRYPKQHPHHPRKLRLSGRGARHYRWAFSLRVVVNSES